MIDGFLEIPATFLDDAQGVELLLCSSSSMMSSVRGLPVTATILLTATVGAGLVRRDAHSVTGHSVLGLERKQPELRVDFLHSGTSSCKQVSKV